MAAIIEPHRHHSAGTARPALRLVTADGGRTALVPVELGLRTVHLVVAVVAFALLLVLSLAAGNGALAGLAPGPTEGVGAAASAATTGPTVEAAAGDTLWSIARRIQPAGDVRSLVDQLVALNGTAPLQPGQAIALPA
jgi:LysM repeat protein